MPFRYNPFSGKLDFYEASLSTPVDVADGGTGASTLTDGGVLLGSGASAITATSQPTDGQVLIGNTGSDPSLGTITAGNATTVTNAPGSITVAVDESAIDRTNLTGVLDAPSGGTGQSSFAVGDIFYADTASSLTKLGVGSNGDVLTLAGGVPTWSTPAAGGGAWTLIESQTVSTGTSVDFKTGIGSTYDVYWFAIHNCAPTGNFQGFWMRISEDGGSTWKSGASDYAWAISGIASSGTAYNAGDTADTQMEVTPTNDGITNNAYTSLSGNIYFYDPSSTALNKYFVGDVVQSNDDTDKLTRREFGANYYGTTNAINGVQFLWSGGGNFLRATISLYGLSES